jgi:hypothetical protein
MALKQLGIFEENWLSGHLPSIFYNCVSLFSTATRKKRREFLWRL